MKRSITVILSAVIVCSLALAGDQSKPASATGEVEKAAKSEKQQPILNNVVKMEVDGKRTALCCCNHEFTVTASAPTLDHDGTLFYMCGEGCKEAASKASKDETAKMMKAWHEKFDAVKMANNIVSKNGRKVATCLCGKTVEVTKTTPYIVENGVKLYLCSEACDTHLHSMAAADRLEAEKKFLGHSASADSK